MFVSFNQQLRFGLKYAMNNKKTDIVDRDNQC